MEEMYQLEYSAIGLFLGENEETNFLGCHSILSKLEFLSEKVGACSRETCRNGGVWGEFCWEEQILLRMAVGEGFDILLEGVCFSASVRGSLFLGIAPFLPFL